MADDFSSPIYNDKPEWYVVEVCPYCILPLIECSCEDPDTNEESFEEGDEELEEEEE